MLTVCSYLFTRAFAVFKNKREQEPVKDQLLPEKKESMQTLKL